MIQIRKPEDLDTTKLPPQIKQFLTTYLQTILQNYGCDSLESIGCIYYLETTSDTLNYSGMGLSHPISETPFEYCELVPVKSSRGESNLLHGCYVFNNDYAIDLFGQESIFEQQTLSTLLDYIERGNGTSVSQPQIHDNRI